MFPESSKITVEQIKDFSRYKEVCKITGESNGENFGDSIDFKYGYIYLYSKNKWAYISIEDGNIKYQYTEKGACYINDCPVTTNRDEIALISKILLDWYNKFGLPKSVTEFKGIETDSVVKEIKINVFNDNADLRILSDGTTYLVFNNFPPVKNKLTKHQINNFDKLLSEAIGKKVVHEDRELFIIFDNSQKTADDIVSFLENFK